MLRTNEFEGHYFNAPYEVSDYSDLVKNIVDEIIFYGSGFGWANSGTKIRRKKSGVVVNHIEVAILFPYIEKAPRESQTDFLRKLMLDVRKELRCYIMAWSTGKTYLAIDGFEWGITRVYSDVHQFALMLRK